MKITSSQYAKALTGIIKEASSGQESKIVDNFLKLLIRNNDLRKFEEIMVHIKEVERNEKGIEEVSIITPLLMEENIRKKVIKKLERLTAKKIILIEGVDKSILGGIIIRFRDYLFDASLLSKIRQLSKSLSK